MDGETWMNAKKALELGFCDEIAFQPEEESDVPENSFTFSRRAVTNCLLDKLRARMPKPEQPKNDDSPAEATIQVEGHRCHVFDNDPKMKLIQYQLMFEGLI